MARPIHERVMARTTAKEPEGCWLFHGAKAEKGHGVIGDKPNRRTHKVHRIMWEYHNGPIPEGACVCHRCDVPNCVNPDHLFLGTKADNNRDMREKMRHSHGSRHWNAKLTEADVVKIWEMRGSMSQTAIAKHFGVDPSHICYIYSGKHWPQLKRSA